LQILGTYFVTADSKEVIFVDKQQKDTQLERNLNNYDYIWGSDQDQYLKEETESEQPATEPEEQDLT
jgi:hypothetical protein